MWLMWLYTSMPASVRMSVHMSIRISVHMPLCASIRMLSFIVNATLHDLRRDVREQRLNFFCRLGQLLVRHGAVWHGAVPRDAAQRGAVPRGTVQCDTVYHTVRICSKPLHTFILYLVIGTKKKLNIYLLQAAPRSHLTFQLFRLGVRCYTT